MKIRCFIGRHTYIRRKYSFSPAAKKQGVAWHGEGTLPEKVPYLDYLIARDRCLVSVHQMQQQRTYVAMVMSWVIGWGSSKYHATCSSRFLFTPPGLEHATTRSWRPFVDGQGF